MSDNKIILSKKVLAISPSETLAISAKAKEMKTQGIDVLALSAGEPDFDTPDHIKKAAQDALAKGSTKYTPAAGTPELRKAICAKLKRDQGLEFEPSRIIVSVGAKHALFNVIFALINEGDEVLIPAPYWLSYPEMVKIAGGKSVPIPTSQAEGFKLTPEALKAAVTDKTKMLLLNSPSNPTGAVYTKDELQALAAVLKEYPQCWIVSDEIYEKLIFDGGKHYSIASLDTAIASRTVIINGHSKAYAMTGWRLGYAACPHPDLAKAISSLQSQSTSNPTSFSQAGGVEALEKGDADAQKMCAIYQRRRDLLFKLISDIKGLKPFYPQGAFYLFVDISGTGMDSVTFSKSLLEEAHVAVVPGKPFGSDKHIRLSFATSEKVLEQAAKRIDDWLKKRS